MSTPNFSGFLSNFSTTSFGSSGFPDILSHVSTKKSVPVYKETTSGNTPAGSVYARYFCVGNLLIQFSDISSDSSLQVEPQYEYKCEFPIPYDDYPYTVIISSFNTEGSYPSPIALIDGLNQLYFRFHVSTQTTGFTFIAIGLRPADLKP